MKSQNSEAKFIVEKVTSSGGVIIRDFRTSTDLLAALQSAIDDGRECVFWPSRSALRILFNTNGFVSVVKDVEKSLQNFYVQVEPSAFDIEHLYVIAPLEGRRGERPASPPPSGR